MSARLQLLLSTLFFTLAQTCVKMIPAIPAHEIVFFRSLVSAVLTLAMLKRAGVRPLGNNKKMLLLRGLFGTAAMVLYFFTLQKMPLASAMTLHYLYPILTVALAAGILKERASLIQWGCLLASFAGVVLIKGFDTRISLVLLAIALCSALFDAITFTVVRALRKQDHALVIVFYLPLVSLIVLAPITFSGFVVPNLFEIATIAMIGIFAQAGQYFVTCAYQNEKSANIANLNYLSPILAVAIGAAVWGEMIPTLAFAGILVIALSSTISSLKVSRIPAEAKPA